MKKIYKSPHAIAVRLRIPTLMLGGGYSVNKFKRGADIMAGDVDDNIGGSARFYDVGDEDDEDE